MALTLKDFVEPVHKETLSKVDLKEGDKVLIVGDGAMERDLGYFRLYGQMPPSLRVITLEARKDIEESGVLGLDFSNVFSDVGKIPLSEVGPEHRVFVIPAESNYPLLRHLVARPSYDVLLKRFEWMGGWKISRSSYPLTRTGRSCVLVFAKDSNEELKKLSKYIEELCIDAGMKTRGDEGSLRFSYEDDNHMRNFSRDFVEMVSTRDHISVGEQKLLNLWQKKAPRLAEWIECSMWFQRKGERIINFDISPTKADSLCFGLYFSPAKGDSYNERF